MYTSVDFLSGLKPEGGVHCSSCMYVPYTYSYIYTCINAWILCSMVLASSRACVCPYTCIWHIQIYVSVNKIRNLISVLYIVNSEVMLVRMCAYMLVYVCSYTYLSTRELSTLISLLDLLNSQAVRRLTVEPCLESQLPLLLICVCMYECM
jgi:hypothetical protein